MRSYNDPYVHCPFDRAHFTPSTRLPFHIAKCPAKKKREADGLPIYYCQYHHLHIYLDEKELRQHELDCPNNLLPKKKGEFKTPMTKNISSPLIVAQVAP